MSTTERHSGSLLRSTSPDTPSPSQHRQERSRLTPAGRATALCTIGDTPVPCDNGKRNARLQRQWFAPEQTGMAPSVAPALLAAQMEVGGSTVARRASSVAEGLPPNQDFVVPIMGRLVGRVHAYNHRMLVFGTLSELTGFANMRQFNAGSWAHNCVHDHRHHSYGNHRQPTENGGRFFYNYSDLDICRSGLQDPDRDGNSYVFPTKGEANGSGARGAVRTDPDTQPVARVRCAGIKTFHDGG